MVLIEIDDPQRVDVRRLLDEHLADMFATSPADSVHALEHSALSGHEVTFWTAREGGQLLSCGALKQLGPALETGSDEFFAPARRLYARHGFTQCPPFGPYVPDPHSVFMQLDLRNVAPPPVRNQGEP